MNRCDTSLVYVLWGTSQKLPKNICLRNDFVPPMIQPVRLIFYDLVLYDLISTLISHVLILGPQLFLLYSGGNTVRRQTIDHVDNFDVFLPLNIEHKVRALQYDPTTDVIYWIEVYHEHAYICTSLANGSDYRELQISDNKDFLTAPLDIALDPYGKQLYWTDDISKNIKVISLATGVIGTLVDGEHSNPVSIALDPKRG